MQGYILWASQKTDEYREYVFWAKNECGYTNILEKCEVYPDYESASNAASRNCFGDVIPIKLKDILPFTHKETRILTQAEEILHKYKEQWRTNEYFNR